MTWNTTIDVLAGLVIAVLTAVAVVGLSCLVGFGLTLGYRLAGGA